MMQIFGAASTAEDVLAGIDLRGKRILVTGASAGIGVKTVRVLVDHGAHVVGTARDVVKAQAAIAPVCARVGGGSIEMVVIDLASLASVRACADDLFARAEPFDVVIANAGVMASPQGSTADGFETQFGTNYLGHFVLINRLASLVRPGGRVVGVSSAGHRRADIALDDPAFERTPYDPLTAYARSKTAVVLFMVEFDRRHAATGIRATAIHPGAIKTPTVDKLIAQMSEGGKDSGAGGFRWKTAEQGAATSVWAGIVAPASEVGGRYCEDCHVAPVNDDPAGGDGVRSYALDPEHAKALWSASEQMVHEWF